MKSLRCVFGQHAQRFLWGVTPSPKKDSTPKWIWVCPRCDAPALSGSPLRFEALAETL